MNGPEQAQPAMEPAGSTAPRGRAQSQFRPSRALVLLALAMLGGLLSDWLRSERVVFARPLPLITTEPAP